VVRELPSWPPDPGHRAVSAVTTADRAADGATAGGGGRCSRGQRGSICWSLTAAGATLVCNHREAAAVIFLFAFGHALGSATSAPGPGQLGHAADEAALPVPPASCAAAPLGSEGR
jgi:hypothetical protein